ncbi:MAG: NAD(P)-dependent alcohol dehydrogenase, partial [Bdellovibrionales bacterium]|nr:NAD(P)-dependent alcohol dehydrogenase [Bdellovibrionales bacterium]
PDGDYTKGGYSTHIVVDQLFILRLPNNLDLAASAPLLCAGITTYSPLKQLGLESGQRVAVVGLGGLGHMGVKLAASFGAEVTVISGSPHKEQDAYNLGAHSFLLSTETSALKQRNKYFDAVLDTVSYKHNLADLLGILKLNGTMILVGAAENPFELPALPLIVGHRKILGSLIGGISETQEMLDHCGRHNITCDIELIAAEQINQAYERVLKSDVKYRFVIDCATF